MQQVERCRYLAALDEAPIVAVIAQELVSGLHHQRVARQLTEFLVTAAEIGFLRTREKIAIEMRACLVVIAELAGERPFLPGMNVGQRHSVAVDVPRIGEKSILAFDCRTVGQKIAQSYAHRITRSRIRIEFAFETVSKLTVRIEVTHGTV